MTTIAVLSDSHGNHDYIMLFLDRIAEKHIDGVIHLGDDYPDAEPIIEAGYSTLRVPGTWGYEYQNPNIDNRRIETIEGWRIGLSHTPKRDYNDLPEDPDPEMLILEKRCDVFLHGHTHKPSIRQENQVIIMNPGHLKAPYDRGSVPTYAQMLIDKELLELSIIELLTDQIYVQKRVNQSKLGG